MIITIVGPTAVGKTKMSIELAKHFNGEIINADSTQFYKELNIATAKVTEEETEGITHHLIDIINPNEKYTVYDYQKKARDIIADIKSRNKTPIIVGGSGLYLAALLYDYNFRKEDNVYDLDSLENDEMYNTLVNLGIDNIDRKNRQRLIRAYAKYVNNSEPVDQSNGGENLFYNDVIILGLTTNRDILYERINRRSDEMIENGLLKEVRKILSKYSDSNEIKTVIGYKEFVPYINGAEGLEVAISRLKQNCRNYAKRQYTWFNHKMDVKWIDVDFNNFDNTVKEAIKIIEKS